MIAQLLNRAFVLERLAVVRDHLAQQPGEFPELMQAIRETQDTEEARSSGQRGGLEPPPAAERRGNQGVADIDDTAFFSRSPLVSLMQSALERYAEDHQLVTTEMVEPDSARRGGETPPAVTSRQLRGVELSVEPDGRRMFGAFEIADIGWMKSAMAMGVRQLRGRHRFNPRPAGPRKISGRARVVLVGDWATGLPRARAVAREMRKVLEQGMAAGLDQHVIHLGDVYYSGWDWEYDTRFLAHWPVAADEADRVSSWSLNGNHDMYSGGHGYFDHLLADRRFGGHESSSFFSLHNDDWEILGLDTGWEEGRLADPQPEWVRERLATSGRRMVFLSHHQLFSAYQQAGTALRSTLRGPLDTGRVRAWFWGHEHRCMLFRAGYNGVGAARCIGHGGVPVHMWRDADEPLPSTAVYEYRARLWEGVEPWALFGFAVLDFDGPTMRVRYIDENGLEHKTESLA